ncbi:MAG TPA: DsrE family protein [Sulfuriferula sp.]|nr:DsrE family protein [Sulfuriferula sp.]
MRAKSIIYVLFALVCAGLAISQPALAASAKSTHAAPAAKQKVVIQVSDNNPKKWALALNNAENVQEDIGKGNVDIEIVAYGPGLPILKLDSPVGTRVADAIASGIKVVACENTMRKTHLTKDDMLPNLDYVKSGVPEIMHRQQEGYAYIRP